MEFAVCVATFYEDLAERLVNGAVEGFELGGVSAGLGPHLSRCRAPSSCPSPRSCCAESGRFAGVACLGVVIRGETNHYDYVCAEAPRGIQRVQLDTGVPCAFGVITGENMEQALARAGGDKRDQGRGAAIVAMRMSLLAQRSAEPRVDPLPSRVRWPRSVTAAASAPRSATRGATRWSRPGGASTRTCRRSASGGGRPHAARLRLRALPEVEQGHKAA